MKQKQPFKHLQSLQSLLVGHHFPYFVLSIDFSKNVFFRTFSSLYLICFFHRFSPICFLFPGQITGKLPSFSPVFPGKIPGFPAFPWFFPFFSTFFGTVLTAPRWSRSFCGARAPRESRPEISESSVAEAWSFFFFFLIVFLVNFFVLFCLVFVWFFFFFGFCFR